MDQAVTVALPLRWVALQLLSCLLVVHQVVLQVELVGVPMEVQAVLTIQAAGVVPAPVPWAHPALP